MGQSRRAFTDEFKAAAVGRHYKPGATQTGVAKELGVTSSQLPEISGTSCVPTGMPSYCLRLKRCFLKANNGIGQSGSTRI